MTTTQFTRLMRSEGMRGFTLMSPTLIYALLLLAIPIGVIITFSFWTQHYLDFDTTLTLKNYAIIWEKPIYQTLLFRSLIVAGTVTLVTVVLAYPIAYFVAFRVQDHKAIWIFLITIPFWTSYLLRIFAWKLVLGYDGLINSTLINLGLIDEPLSFILYNMNAVIVTLSHAWLPFAILPIYVSLEKIDRSLLEAATDLGDKPLMRFLRVTLPLSLPGVIAATLVVFIPTVGDYVTPKLVGGKDGVMIANFIQIQFGKANNWPLGAALAITAMVCVTAVAVSVAGFIKFIGSRIR
ncbi:ABC transporter permease [Pacificispira spongiicola]|uniref:ABC transporter permease n=1 Tax=Pacificispira spongiicola TaxID=2729598 RepID=UPI0029CAA9AA|nr:ABC transporter permease [Pacificispira spongiicola]